MSALLVIVLLQLAAGAQRASAARPAPPSVVGTPPPARPALGGTIDGQYIVVFKAGTGTAAAATEALQSHVLQAVATATGAPAVDGAAAAAAASASLHIVRSLSEVPRGAAPGTATVAAAVAAAASGVQGVVVSIRHPSVLAAVRVASHVAAVIPDTVVASQQVDDSSCVEAAELSRGLAAGRVSPSFKWPACLSNRTELRWIGERCRDGMDQIRYTAAYTVYRGTNLVMRVQGQECIFTPNSVNASLTWARMRFGGCGTPPVLAPSLPTCIKPAPASSTEAAAGDGGSSNNSCLEATITQAGEELITTQLTLATSVRCGGRSVSTLTYIGTRCGLHGQYVSWVRAVGPGSCNVQRGTEEGRVKFNSDLFGACGVPPGRSTRSGAMVPVTVCSSSSSSNSTAAPPDSSSPSPSPAPGDALPSPSPSAPEASSSPSPSPVEQQPSPSPSPAPAEQQPSPSPSPPPPRLPREPLQAGEEVPTGVARIEAATAAGVFSTSALRVPAAQQQLLVAVMDSGVDASLPDLNYAGGMSWVPSSSPAAGEPDDGDADVDNFGHGTHVAGIIGARNSGARVVGVSPGVPLYSLKVLDGGGRGMLSTVLSAVKWAATVGVARGIRVINLSLAAFVDPESASYADTAAIVCGVFQEAADAGVLVTVAAGNYGADVRGYFPAACALASPPSVLAVTALDASGIIPAGYSNYVPAAGAPAPALAHVIAAPASGIRSTVPLKYDPSGVSTMSGTSMAAPHVAGVAVNCLLSGACQGSGGADSVVAALQAAAQQRLLQAPRYGFIGDASSTRDGRYFGRLVWSGGF